MAIRSTSVASLGLLAAMVGITVLGVQCASADPLPARGPGASACPRCVLECPRCVLEDDATDPPDVATPHLELVAESSERLPTFTDGARRFVLGQTGTRYRVKIVNPTAARIEAVVSVDGLDAIDGRTADLSKRGYVVAAYGETIVDGWRTSLDAVATFRFSTVAASYAGRKGRDRNVGVVGVAFFQERPPVVTRRLPERWRAAPSESTASEDRDAPAGAPATTGAGAGAAPAPAAKSASEAHAEPRPGLGTQFGEAQDSHVVEVGFVRASGGPAWVSELRYDDRAGLLARGISLDPPRDPRSAENARRDEAEAFPHARFAQPPP